VRADELDVEVWKSHTHADLVIGVAEQEDGKAGAQRFLAGRCQPAGHADQVALGDAHIEEAIGEFIAKVCRTRGIAHVAVYDDDVFVFPAQLAERLAKGVASAARIRVRSFFQYP
jgi:hypothetical protein